MFKCVIFTVITALLLVSALGAQSPGELWRTPTRILQVDSANATYVWYTVRESDKTPSTVGRKYRVLRTSFLRDYLKVTPLLAHADSIHAWPRTVQCQPNSRCTPSIIVWFPKFDSTTNTIKSVPTWCMVTAGGRRGFSEIELIVPDKIVIPYTRGFIDDQCSPGYVQPLNPADYQNYWKWQRRAL